MQEIECNRQGAKDAKVAKNNMECISFATFAFLASWR
jgi:hypothetical protein